MRKRQKHCRWCGITYIGLKPIDRDGFCSTAHKQAHYRAYRKYITTTNARSPRIAGKPKNYQ